MYAMHSTAELDPLQIGFQMPSKVCMLKAWVLVHNTIADDAAIQKCGLGDRNEFIRSMSCKGLWGPRRAEATPSLSFLDAINTSSTTQPLSHEGLPCHKAQNIMPSNRQLKPLSLWAQTNLSTSSGLSQTFWPHACYLPSHTPSSQIACLINLLFFKSSKGIWWNSSLANHFRLDSSSISSYCRDL